MMLEEDLGVGKGFGMKDRRKGSGIKGQAEEEWRQGRRRRVRTRGRDISDRWRI